MQLKRDTDYALRLMLGVAKYADENGILLVELCRHASVPQTIASRLCSKLVKTGFLRENKAGSQSLYFAGDDIRNKTLLDVVQAIEGTADMFAVFDHSTELYACGKYEFALAERQLAESLGGISLQRLINQAAMAG